MEELGVVEASQAIAASKAFTEASQALPRAPRRPPQYVILKAEDLRRSVRCEPADEPELKSLYQAPLLHGVAVNCVNVAGTQHCRAL